MAIKCRHSPCIVKGSIEVELCHLFSRVSLMKTSAQFFLGLRSWFWSLELLISCGFQGKVFPWCSVWERKGPCSNFRDSRCKWDLVRDSIWNHLHWFFFFLLLSASFGRNKSQSIGKARFLLFPKPSDNGDCQAIQLVLWTAGSKGTS